MTVLLALDEQREGNPQKEERAALFAPFDEVCSGISLSLGLYALLPPDGFLLRTDVKGASAAAVSFDESFCGQLL